jgi:hypothetical protein
MVLKILSLKSMVSNMLKAGCLAFGHLRGSKELAAAVVRNDVITRERIYTPEVTAMMFCQQALSNNSLQDCVNQLNVDRAMNGLPPVSTNTGSLAEARSRLPSSVLQEAACEVAQNMETYAEEQWLWHDMKIKLIDGTTITAADSPANQSRYPQHGQQKEGAGFPLIRLVAVISYRTGAIFDCAYGPNKGKGSGEQGLAWPLLKHFGPGDLALADSYYASYFNMSQLIKQGSQFVFHSHGARKVDFRSGQKIGKRDHLVTLKRPQKPDWMSTEEYESHDPELIVRECNLSAHEDGKRPRKMVVVTSLLDSKKFSKEALASVYAERWEVELRLREIKSTLGMDHIDVKTPEMIDKMLWAYALAYNEIRRIILESGKIFGVHPIRYSFKNAVQSFELWWPQLSRARSIAEEEEVMVSLLAHIASVEVGKRPGRSEPRRRKKRPKPGKYLTKPRSLYQTGVQA